MHNRTKKLQGGMGLGWVLVGILGIGGTFYRSSPREVNQIVKNNGVHVVSPELIGYKGLEAASTWAKGNTVGVYTTTDGTINAVFGEDQKQFLSEEIQDVLQTKTVVAGHGGPGVSFPPKTVYELPLTEENKKLVEKSVKSGIVGNTCYNPSGEETECKVPYHY